MRALIVAFGVMVVAQAGVPPRDSGRVGRRSLDSLVLERRARRCVPTAPMPVAGLRGRLPERMPMVRPDSTRDTAMVLRVVPCYLVDSGVVKAPR